MSMGGGARYVAAMIHPIRLKRVYDPPAADDGRRILVERLWPRGLSKDRAAVDLWARDIAPSPGLRKWYGHKPELWEEFQVRYRTELGANAAAVEALARECATGPVTFVFAARDADRCSALVLKEYLEERGG